MDESKELEKLYSLFRLLVYFSVIMEVSVFVPREWLGAANIVVDRIRPFTIYHNVVWSKLLTILLVIITSIGTRAKKRLDFDPSKMVYIPLLSGLVILASSVVFLHKGSEFIYGYVASSFLGVILVHIALDSLSKMIKDQLGQDKFNLENESFDQKQEEKNTPVSVNIPTKYYYRGKMRDSWINVENPFRGTWVLGTPGSGKTFSIIEPVIRQHSSKGFCLVVYDYKFPTLAIKLYYHYLKAVKTGKAPKDCKFRMINFTRVEFSHRINPIQKKYIPNLAAASETASTLIESLQKGQQSGGSSDDFFKKSSENYLAAIIYFFTRYEKGKYASMAHVLTLLNQDYRTQFDVLMTNKEIQPLLAPFMTAYQNKAMDQLEGMIGTLRVECSRLATKEAFWIFTGDDFDLKVSDPSNPSYLLIANDPEMESINSSLNALIINRLVTRVNSGGGKNIPVNIIIDELPTIYFHKIDRLVGTARSNKVAVTLGFQELPQLEADYGKIGMQKVISVCANVICASARHKETLDWLSQSIFGKVKQVKKGISIDHAKTSISLNEEMGDLVPASRIADMPTGFLCGQIARDFVQTKTKRDGSINVQEAEEFRTTKFYAKTNFNMDEIHQEEAEYPDKLPLIYDFGSEDKKEELLSKNFEKVLSEVDEICRQLRLPE